MEQGGTREREAMDRKEEGEGEGEEANRQGEMKMKVRGERGERERQSKGWKRRRGRDDVGAEKGGKVIKKEKVKRKMAHTQTGGRSVYGLPASCAQRAEAACVER